MKNIMFFLAIFISLAIAYIAAHLLLFLAFTKFFALSAFSQKVLAWVLLAFGASFFVSSALSHWRDNIFTRAYYFITGSWMGLGVNLLLFFLLAWIVVRIAWALHYNPNMKVLGILAIAAAIIYSAYGIWNAFTPKVVHVDVAIDNLPQSWVGKKIVQISDVHLGHIYREGYINMVADKINALKPDAIVISGDLFDGMDGNLQTFVDPLNKLDAPKGIFFSTGNHETYLGTQKTLDLIAKTKITVLQDKMENVDGLQFVGIKYPERLENINLESAIKSVPGFDAQKPSILLWHTPTQIQGAKDAGISLMLSGHTHKGQLFPFGIITWLVYHGYDYGFHRDGSFAIYTSSGLGGWGPPMRTEERSEIVEITLR